MFTSTWFSRLLKAVAINIVEPTVIDASQSSILDPAIAQICPPVGAAAAE
jgi:hypothetical protein